MLKQEKIFITGMGIVSCLGSDLDSVSKSLQEGKSGIVFDSSLKKRGFRSGLTASLKGFDSKKYGLKKKQLKSMGEPALFAYAASVDALKDACLDVSVLPEKTGIIIGNDSCVKASSLAIENMKEFNETRHVGSGAIFQTMNSTASMNIAVLMGIRGYNLTVSAACSSGAHAIGHAFHLLKLGLLDTVICGGTQELNWQVYASFDALGAFSMREDNPANASRPFDKQRDGLVPSGGAAMIVLEREGALKKRGVSRVYGEIAGYGFSSDGTYLSLPSGDGGERALKMALHSSGIKPEKVDCVHAHATSTPEGDRVEAKIISGVFGSDVPVSSTKSLTGHECWMSGASEMVYSCLMMKGGFITGNVNFQEQEPEALKVNVVSKTCDADLKVIVSNSFGFGGTNAVLILRKI